MIIHPINMENPTFILLFVDVPDDVEFELNTWYDTEHIPQMLGVDGVLTAKRFRSRTDQPRYMAWYDLDSPEILYREGALSVRPQDPRATAWSRSMRPKMLSARRGVYETLATEAGAAGGLPRAATTVVVLGFNADQVPPDNHVAWFQQQVVPWFAELPAARIAHWARLHPRAQAPAEAPGNFVLCIELHGPAMSSPELTPFDRPLPEGLVRSFSATYESLVIGASQYPVTEPGSVKMFRSELESIGLHVTMLDAENIRRLANNVERAARSIPVPEDFGLEPLIAFRLPVVSDTGGRDA